MAELALPQITYAIAMPYPHTHLYHVSIRIAQVQVATVDCVLPAWTPGSYLIREYARHVQDFAAVVLDDDETPLQWTKTAKDTWRVETQGAEHIRVSYKVYAYELSVRTSHLDGSHGYFNGANVFMYVPDRTHESLALNVLTPPGAGWKVTTALEEWNSIFEERRSLNPDMQTFVARDYDELVDCPVECGTHRLLTFYVDDIRHDLAIWGHGNEDEQQLVQDTRRIVEVERDLFGGLPYPHYTFILHLADRYGGLEHRNSVTNIVHRWSFHPRKSYERFLELQAHELFHVWNVKHIRPAVLATVDYQRENYTRLLWAMEGVTSYYDRLLLVRAGLLEPERYLESLVDEILRLQSQPGRAVQSLEASSFDAWIKFYRPDENSVNSSISYYLKGGLVLLLLDLEIRWRTGGQRSFDDVLRYLYQTYPFTGEGIPEGNAYLKAVEAVAGDADGAYRDFFARYVSGTDELDYARAFDFVGLRMEWRYKQSPRHGDVPAWLGVRLKQEQGRTLVKEVYSDSPAAVAGIYAEDELLALNGLRVGRRDLQDRLNECRPGDTLGVTLFRRDELLHIPVVLAEAPHDDLKLARIEQPDTLQEMLYRDWLGLGV